MKKASHKYFGLDSGGVFVRSAGGPQAIYSGSVYKHVLRVAEKLRCIQQIESL